MTPPLTAAGRALQAEYPGVWYWEDSRWEGVLGAAIERDAERIAARTALAKAAQDFVGTLYSRCSFNHDFEAHNFSRVERYMMRRWSREATR